MRDWVRKICQRSEKYVGKIELIGRGVLLKLYSAGSVDKGKKWMGVDNFLLLQKIFTSSLLSLPPCSRRRVLCSHISPPRSRRHNHAGTNIIIMLLLSAAFLTYRRNARTCNFN